MSNEFGVCVNSLNATIKNDSAEKADVMDRYCINGPTSLSATVAPPPPPSSSNDIPRPNLNVGSTSWNYNPYIGNFYNYYTSQSYNLGDVSHQYTNQKCGSQFTRNYQQPLPPSSVLQCCDPRCQLLSEHTKYPCAQTLCTSKPQQKSKRSRSYYSGLLDLPKSDITSRSQEYAAAAAASKYTPMVPYSTHINDLNARQQFPYNSQYQTAVKSSGKSLLLAESNAYGGADFGKQSCWNKPPNLWNPNVSNSYYSSIPQNGGMNHKFSGPLLEQNGISGAVKQHNVPQNHALLDSRSTLYDSSYIPNYHYMNNRPVQAGNMVEHRRPTEECSYSHYPTMDNPHQFQPVYNPHCSVSNSEQNPYYKELLLKSAEKPVTRDRVVENKGPNLDVREFLSTWDEGEDDKQPDGETPVIVLDCTSLEGDVLAKVKEKLGDTISDCNSLDNSTASICDLESQSNATVLKVVDDTNDAISLPKHTSVIQDSSVDTVLKPGDGNKVDNDADKATSESSHLNSDGFMTWYSNAKKRDDPSYDLVEMTERLVNSVDKLFSEPEKKPGTKVNNSLPNVDCQLPSQSVLDEVYIENEWNMNFNFNKKDADRTSLNVANHCYNQPSKYKSDKKENPLCTPTLSDLVTNGDKNSSWYFGGNKTTSKPVADVACVVTNYEGASTKVQNYSVKYKNMYEHGADYYSTDTNNMNYQYYNSCYFPNVNANSCNFTNSLEDTNATSKYNSTNYVDHTPKNSVNDSEMTQMRADLEKSLHEITNGPNDFSDRNQKTSNGIEAERSTVTNSADSEKSILEIGVITSTESPVKISSTTSDVSSYSGVIQKTGVCNSPILEVKDKEEDCENSLLSMPSLSPPPTSILLDTSPKNLINNAVNDNVSDNMIQKEEVTNANLSAELEETVNGDAPQPLNLAIDKDSTKFHDLPLCNGRTIEVSEDALSDEKSKDWVSNKNVDSNTTKVDDGYYSIENNFDYDSESHKILSNGTETGGPQLKGSDDAKAVGPVTYQSCIVSRELYESNLEENANHSDTLCVNDGSNVKSVSAPPSVADSESFSPKKPEIDRKYQSLIDLHYHSGDRGTQGSPVDNDEGFSVREVMTADSEDRPYSNHKEENQCPTSLEAIPVHDSVVVSINSPDDAHVDKRNERYAESTRFSAICSTQILESENVNSESRVESVPRANVNIMDGSLPDLSTETTSFDDAESECSATSPSVEKSCIERVHSEAMTNTPNEDAEDVLVSNKLSLVECAPTSSYEHATSSSTSVITSPSSRSHAAQNNAEASITPAADNRQPDDTTMEFPYNVERERIYRKKFKHKKHKSKKSRVYSEPYDCEKRIKGVENNKLTVRENDSVIKENTNLINTNHTTVQDLETRLSNIRQRLPNDTLLFKCCSPCDNEYPSAKVEKISKVNVCQDENEILGNSYEEDVVISIVNSHHPPNELNNCQLESAKLGKHLFTHKNADLPMKKRKQDLSIYSSVEKLVAKEESMLSNGSPHQLSESDVNGNIGSNGEEDYCCSSKRAKMKSKVNHHFRKKFKKLHRRFSFSEDSGAKTVPTAGNDVPNEYRRTKSLIDWRENQSTGLHSPRDFHPSLTAGIQSSSSRTPTPVENIMDPAKSMSVSNPCISNVVDEEKFFHSSFSLPSSPCAKLHFQDNFALQCTPLPADEFLPNKERFQDNDELEECNDRVADVSYYDYSIPSVAPTPQCDLSKEDKFESESVEIYHDSDTVETFPQSPSLNAPSTPNCDFSVGEEVIEDFAGAIQSSADPALSSCAYNEETERISSKAPSPCCMLNDIIIDELAERSPYQQPFTVLSPASSVAPSPQCDIVDGVILDGQDSSENSPEPDDNNNNHHSEFVDFAGPVDNCCGVPTLQSLAFEALDGMCTESSNSFEVWVDQDRSEIIIHSDEQEDATDIVVSSGETVSFVETDESGQETSTSVCEEMIPDCSEDSHLQSAFSANEHGPCEEPCCSLNPPSVVASERGFVEKVDDPNENLVIDGCDVNDINDLQYTNDCIEETFIDQKISCSPPTHPAQEVSPNTVSEESVDVAENDTLKVHLPWHKIFKLSDGSNNESVGLLRGLELGPAQIEVRLSSEDGCGLRKVVNSGAEFLSSVLQVKRLVLQPAASVNEDDENGGGVSSHESQRCDTYREERRFENIVVEEEAAERRQSRRSTRFNLRKKSSSRTSNMNGIIGVPKMVIKKTSCREYRSYLQANEFTIPTVRLQRSKYLDELARKMALRKGVGCSINIHELDTIMSPDRCLRETSNCVASMLPDTEEDEQFPIDQVTNTDSDYGVDVLREEDADISDNPESAAVDGGIAVPFPKSLPERHHCLLCHRTYSSEELYQLHVKSKLHRHLELAQRKTIHAMYRYFTGHLCPRLPPLSVDERKRMKWKPRKTGVNHFYHQKTPLQIALHKSVFHRRK